MLFGSGMRGALYTCTMDEERRKTLQTLVALWREPERLTCWGSEDAAHLLRTQSSAEELREIGVDEETIEMIWPEP